MPLQFVDRQLFCRLVMKLDCEPKFCLCMIALWKWVERPVEQPTIVPRLLSAEDPELVAVMKETKNVIYYFFYPNTPIQRPRLPQTQRLFSESQFAVLNFTLHQDREAGKDHISETVDNMLNMLEATRDIDLGMANDMNWLMRLMQQPEINDNNILNPMQVVQAGVGGYPIVLMNEDGTSQIPLGNRTLFISITAGYSFTEEELTSYFTRRNMGMDIEFVRMGRIHPPLVAPWYAHVVFQSADTTRMILDGHSQAILRLNDSVKCVVAGGFF